MFWNKRIYLDYAAGAKGNPSSAHAEGRAAKKMLEDARTEIARMVEVKPDDVIFTSGATEANAIAILGIISAKQQASRTKLHALYLPSAHASIVENMKLLAERGVEIEELPINPPAGGGRVDCEQLAKMIRPETVLVAMDAVCGETGTIWNTREVANVLERSRHAPSEGRSAAAPSPQGAPAARPIQPFVKSAAAPLLHVDASQAPMTEKISRSHFGADTLAFDSAKVGWPRGTGCLIAHRTIPIEPLYRGGGQERGLRNGTENPEAAQGFAAALRAAALGRETFAARAAKQRAGLLAHLSTISNLVVNVGAESAPNILNISLPDCDTDYLVALLDEAGFAVSTRSACETDSQEGSRAVFTLTGDEARARSTLRISWSPATSGRALARFAVALDKILKSNII